MSTHQQLLYHIVFSTKLRKPYLKDGLRERTFAYMAGTAKSMGGFALKVGGYYDHAHLLLRLPPTLAVSSFVGRLKASISKHINDSSGALRKFGWQEGFGAFTVSMSQQARVVAYIENQMTHHGKESFQTEYVRMLTKHAVDYNPKYLWE